MVSREKPEGWIIESMRLNRPNVVSFKLVAGDQRTQLIGAYLPPSTLDLLPDLEEALNLLPGREPIILGYINVGIRRLSNPRDQQVENLLVYFRLVDLLAHFRQRLRYHKLQTW